MSMKKVLGSCNVFAMLKDSELERVASLTSERNYDAGSTIFREGDSANELFVLEVGRVALQLTMHSGNTQAGRKVSVDVISPLEVFGWSSVIEPHVYKLGAVCLQDVKVLAINGNELRWLLEDNHDIGYEVMKGLGRIVALRLEDTRRLLASERLVT